MRWRIGLGEDRGLGGSQVESVRAVASSAGARTTDEGAASVGGEERGGSRVWRMWRSRRLEAASATRLPRATPCRARSSSFVRFPNAMVFFPFHSPSFTPPSPLSSSYSFLAVVLCLFVPLARIGCGTRTGRQNRPLPGLLARIGCSPRTGRQDRPSPGLLMKQISL